MQSSLQMYQASSAFQQILPSGRQVTSTGIARRPSADEARTAAEQNRRRAETMAMEHGYAAFANNADAGCAICTQVVS